MLLLFQAMLFCFIIQKNLSLGKKFKKTIIQKDTLNTNIFLHNQIWPNFDDFEVLTLSDIE